MDSQSPRDLALFDQIENKTKWAVARAYRAKRRERYGDHEARWAAIDTLQAAHPEMSPEDVQKVVAVTIVNAYRDHTEWMNDGINGPLRDDRVK